MKLKRKKEIFIHCITIDFIAFHIFQEKIILQFAIKLIQNKIVHYNSFILKIKE